MKVLLTGATGYTGKGIAQILHAEHHVRGMDVRQAACDVDELVTADLADLDACMKAVDGMDAMVLCHMAPNPIGYKTPPMAFDTNVKGTANLYHAAVQCKVKQAVLISSMGVVKKGATDSVPGEGPYAWGHEQLYAVTKIIQECLAKHYQEANGISTAILRPAWIVYDEQCVTKYGDKLTHYSSGLIDPRDIGLAALAALKLNAPGLTWYNIGQDDAPFDGSAAHDRLGWRPQYRFTGLTR